MGKKILVFIPLVLLVIVLTISEVYAAPYLEKTYSFSELGNQIVYDMQLTLDNRIIIVGTSVTQVGPPTALLTVSNLYLLRTDLAGNKIWGFSIGRSGSEGYSVQDAGDGGFVAVGSTLTQAGDRDVYLIKTDSLGNLQWEKTFGEVLNDYGYSIKKTFDGGYIIAGSTYFTDTSQEFYLIKTDAAGNLIWEKKVSTGNIMEVGRDIQLTKDGGYIVIGWSAASILAGSNVKLLKIDAQGNVSGHAEFDLGFNDIGYSIVQTVDGGYVVTGNTDKPGDSDAFLLKIDPQFNTQWLRIYGGNKTDGGYSVKQTPEGGFVICGVSNSFGLEGNKVFLIKTDENGFAQWHGFFGDGVKGGDNSGGKSVQIIAGGGYVIAGYTTRADSDVYLVRTFEVLDNLANMSIRDDNLDLKINQQTQSNDVFRQSLESSTDSKISSLQGGITLNANKISSLQTDLSTTSNSIVNISQRVEQSINMINLPLGVAGVSATIAVIALASSLRLAWVKKPLTFSGTGPEIMRDQTTPQFGEPKEKPNTDVEEKKYYGKYAGIVVNTKDPSNLGRLKVKVPNLFGDDEIWALPSSPYGGNGVGMVFIPPIGASIWVEFAEGSAQLPIWSGCWWVKDEMPYVETNEKILKTETATIKIIDKQGESQISIENNSGIKLMLNEEGIVLFKKDSKVTLL